MAAEKQNTLKGVLVVIEHQAEDKSIYSTSLPSVARRLAAQDEEYAGNAEQLRALLTEQLTHLEIEHRIRVNPGPGSNWEKDKAAPTWWRDKLNPAKGIRYPRVGSFEVMLRLPSEWFPPSSYKAPCSSRPPRCMAWSKLQSCVWPEIEDLAQSIVKVVTAAKVNDGVGWHDFLNSQSNRVMLCEGSRAPTPLLRDAGISPIPTTDLKPAPVQFTRPLSTGLTPRPNSSQSARVRRPKPNVPERPSTAEPGFPEPWVEAKWKANKKEIEREGLEESKGNVMRPVQVDVFGGLNVPVKPPDKKQNARMYKHLREALAARKSLKSCVDHKDAQRSASTPPGWSESWVKQKWSAKREQTANERGAVDLPPRVPDLLGARYQHPPWIRLLQQPLWRVELEEKDAIRAKENMAKIVHYPKEPPPAPVNMEERPPGPVIHKVIRDERSEERYLATVIGRTAAKQVMVARRDNSEAMDVTPPPSWS
eukprot:gnl/MRDRNA2_/MRDRNA2_107699_c0_seq1.p1 gnl/MRDRNA2_/MRDRNA2_107699_c0~~gnl/MRDRNA2_/MRDRNA2_107699_c0_seq1.p1  ORF type:complete len:479 (+),score=71.17 gnl/MRDRNA2_/MRDRNA2_107699_c0_seq1:109-1545(+)